MRGRYAFLRGRACARVLPMILAVTLYRRRGGMTYGAGMLPLRGWASLRGSACLRVLPMICGLPLSEAGRLTHGGGMLPLRWVYSPAAGLACPCSR